MANESAWVTHGFEAFRRGTFGNAGHNLYVSRAGVLQRIHQFGLHRNGYVDLIFCNSQNHWERPPAYLYHDPLGAVRRVELPSDSAVTGAVADLNGDGYDDLVLGMFYNGIRYDLNSFIYYGSPEGPSERRQQLLPTPRCNSAAIGDFNGDGRTDLAFLCEGKLRIFYQSELGFEPKRFVDIDLSGIQLGADDLDGDGHEDLIVRSRDGRVHVYWGGPEGIRPDRHAELDVADVPAPQASQSPTMVDPSLEPQVLVKVVRLGPTPHVFVGRPERAFLIPVGRDRQFGVPLVLQCPKAYSIAVGDFNGDGIPDLALACRQPGEGGEISWVYWGGPDGFSEDRRTRLPSLHASDVAAGDLDGDGCDEVVLCQEHSDGYYTSESLVYRGGRNGIHPEPVRLVTEDAQRVFIVRMSDDPKPQLLFVNRHSRERLGDIKVSIFPGGPDGFSPERRITRPGWGAVEALYADLNDNGHPDLLLANCAENSIDRDPGSYVYLNGPHGLPETPTMILPTTRAMSACCADLNRDGYLDLIFAGFNNPEILILYGTANGFDTTHPQRIRIEHEGQPFNELRVILLADLNNDGWLDLFVPDLARDRSLVLWGGPDGFSLQHSQALSVWHACCARAADLNGNGYVDLIVGGHQPSQQGPHDSFVYIYWNGPDGLREDRRTLLPANAVNAMAVADFNRDGTLDLFVTSYHAMKDRDVDSYIYWNRKGCGFSVADRTRLFTHSASGAVAADFNDNGWIDLAIAYHKVGGDHTGYSAVWWNGPDGFDQKRITCLPTAGPHGMISAEPGNQHDRGPEEYYVSEPFKLPDGCTVSQVSWQGDLPPRTWVKAQLRFAADRENLNHSPWLGPRGKGDWFSGDQRMSAHEYADRWVQYRLALGAWNGCATPRVTEVSIHYESAV